MHALIIEDESMIALAIEDALRACGFTSFDIAVSAEEAVAAGRAKVSGPDHRRRRTKAGLSHHGPFSQSVLRGPIPVIFITGSPGQVRIRMPGHALVEKPFRADHIMEATKLTLDSRDG